MRCASPVYPGWAVHELLAGFDGEAVDRILLEARKTVSYAAGDFEFGEPDPGDASDEEHLRSQ